MNKNLPILLLGYLSSLLLIFTLESWFMLWFLLELNTLTFTGLILMHPHSKSSENSISYFIAQVISSLVILVSIFSILYISSPQKVNFTLNLGLFFKLATAPFQAWLIPLSMHLPWNTLLLLVTTQKITPLVFLEMARPENSIFVMSLCMTTCLIGSLTNLMSNSLKFLLVFSALSSTGWLILALTTSSSVWKFFLSIYFINLLVIYLQFSKKTKKVTNPLILVTWLSIAGLPPFLGFFPKVTILFFLGESSFFLFLLILLLVSVFDIFVYISKTYNSLLTPPSKAWLGPNKAKMLWKSSWVFLNVLGFTCFY